MFLSSRKTVATGRRLCRKENCSPETCSAPRALESSASTKWSRILGTIAPYLCRMTKWTMYNIGILRNVEIRALDYVHKWADCATHQRVIRRAVRSEWTKRKPWSILPLPVWRIGSIRLPSRRIVWGGASISSGPSPRLRWTEINKDRSEVSLLAYRRQIWPLFLSPYLWTHIWRSLPRW